MAHFAKIENGVVTNVLVVDNEHETYGEEYLNNLGLEGKWVQTSYNASFGKKFAGIGDAYDDSDDTFKPAQPYPSWLFDQDSWRWKAPVDYPGDGQSYTWNEDSLSWEPLEEEAE
jgi:hypothetical protein